MENFSKQIQESFNNPSGANPLFDCAQPSPLTAKGDNHTPKLEQLKSDKEAVQCGLRSYTDLFAANEPKSKQDERQKGTARDHDATGVPQDNQKKVQEGLVSEKTIGRYNIRKFQDRSDGLLEEQESSNGIDRTFNVRSDGKTGEYESKRDGNKHERYGDYDHRDILADGTVVGDSRTEKLTKTTKVGSKTISEFEKRLDGLYKQEQDGEKTERYFSSRKDGLRQETREGNVVNRKFDGRQDALAEERESRSQVERMYYTDRRGRADGKVLEVEFKGDQGDHGTRMIQYFEGGCGPLKRSEIRTDGSQR